VSLTRRALLLASASSALACDRSHERTHEQPRGAARIVSVAPSMTETLFALGLGASVVGRSSFCDQPAEAQSIEVVGGFADPNLEKIVSLRPTLLCGERGPAGPTLPERAGQLGIPTFFPPMDSVDQILEAIEALGARLDVGSAANALTTKVRTDLAATAARVADRPRPRVALLFDFRPIVAAGPGTFPHELLLAGGATNPVSGAGKYPKLSAEGLLALDPDVILDGSAGAYAERPEQLLAEVTGLSQLRALREGRVHRLSGTAALRPGPRVAEGVRDIAALLHPEAR
jgi:iron complex transport system substrate-binding protein